jgi:hypothetical protein
MSSADPETKGLGSSPRENTDSLVWSAALDTRSGHYVECLELQTRSREYMWLSVGYTSLLECCASSSIQVAVPQLYRNRLPHLPGMDGCGQQWLRRPVFGLRLRPGYPRIGRGSPSNCSSHPSRSRELAPQLVRTLDTEPNSQPALSLARSSMTTSHFCHRNSPRAAPSGVPTRPTNTLGSLGSAA